MTKIVNDPEFAKAIEVARHEAAAFYGKPVSAVSAEDAIALQQQAFAQVHNDRVEREPSHGEVLSKQNDEASKHASAHLPPPARKRAASEASEAQNKRPCPPSPPDSTASSVFDRDYEVSPPSSPATSVSNITRADATRAEKLRLAHAYLEHAFQYPDRFVWDDFAYIAAQALGAQIRVWSAKGDGTADVRLSKNHSPKGDVSPTQVHDIAFDGKNHFVSFRSPALPVGEAQEEGSFDIRNSDETIADGACFMHALAQCSNLNGYNSMTDTTAKRAIASSLRATFLSEARQLISGSNPDPDAVEALYNCAHNEAEHLLRIGEHEEASLFTLASEIT